jgi:hypothetical protein
MPVDVEHKLVCLLPHRELLEISQMSLLALPTATNHRPNIQFLVTASGKGRCSCDEANT